MLLLPVVFFFLFVVYADCLLFFFCSADNYSLRSAYLLGRALYVLKSQSSDSWKRITTDRKLGMARQTAHKYIKFHQFVAKFPRFLRVRTTYTNVLEHIPAVEAFFKEDPSEASCWENLETEADEADEADEVSEADAELEAKLDAEVDAEVDAELEAEAFEPYELDAEFIGKADKVKQLLSQGQTRFNITAKTKSGKTTREYNNVQVVKQNPKCLKIYCPDTQREIDLRKDLIVSISSASGGRVSHDLSEIVTKMDISS